MSDIFISHAVADQALAKLLVGFLKEAIGVPEKAIFCSSVKGHHIPLSVDFNTYIKQKIQRPKLVILLMTPAYMESSFCLMELGAAWAQDAKSLAIVVPPTDFDIVTKTLGLKQAWKITDKSGLIDFKNIVVEAVPNLEKRSEHTWEDKRTNWNAALRKLLQGLQKSTKVDAEKYEEALETLKEKEAEIEHLEDALAAAQERYAELEKVKDKEELKALKKRLVGSQVLEDEFEALIKAVKGARPSNTTTTSFKHIILDHFGLAGEINWYEDKYDFEQAIKYGLVSREDFKVLWDRPKLKPLGKALDAVEAFLDSDEGEEFKKLQEDGVPMEPHDLEFWEYHLSL